MSIQFKLNRDATSITISRSCYVQDKLKTSKLTTLDFNTNQIDLPHSLTEIEQEKTQLWIKNQKKLIEKAYKMYSRLGYVGGTPAVSESGKYNSKFKDFPGCNLEASAYSFLGCIKGARKLSLKVDAPSSIEMEEIINNNELATVAKSIIGAYTHKLISNPDLFADKIYSSDDVEQLIEIDLLISKFIAASRIKQSHVRAGGVEDRVDQYFKELIESDEGYLVGKKLKVSTLLKQKNTPIKIIDNSDRAITSEERERLNNHPIFNKVLKNISTANQIQKSDKINAMREEVDRRHRTNIG